MRVLVEGLAPDMKHHDHTQAGAPAIAGEGLQGLGGGLEQQIVDDHGVVACQGQQGVGQREDDVEVLDGQQLQLSGVNPSAALAGPAFGAMAVPAGIVADFDMPAVFAGVIIKAVPAGIPGRFHKRWRLGWPYHQFRRWWRNRS